MDRLTFEIALTLGLVALILIAFLKEWAPPDVIALSSLCLVVALGLIPMERMSEVFRNEAPITIAALFVIGGALEASGAVDQLGLLLRNRLRGGLRNSILCFSLLAAFCSAWMNNTAIVAILLPVVLGFARSKDIVAARLLMPLSYASILGGCCTLIGTSTNLLANGVLTGMQQEPMSMFELAPIGVPVAVIGIAYMTWFGPKLIPARTSIIAELDPKSRSTKMYHVLVTHDCPLVGSRLIDSPLAAEEAGIHLVELRRGGRKIISQLGDVVIEKFDRYLVTLHNKQKTSPESFFEKLSMEVISEIDGIVTELVIEADSSLVGQTLAQSHFRQQYNTVVLALHRDGRNITRSLASELLSPGDTLLVVTASFNLGELKQSKDFLLTDTPDDTPPVVRRDAWLAGLSLIGVVTVATASDLLNNSFPSLPKIPIHYAAMVGALLLLWTRTLTPRQAYQSIDWQVLFMLYGLLGLGMAMQTTGTAEFLAHTLVEASIH